MVAQTQTVQMPSIHQSIFLDPQMNITMYIQSNLLMWSPLYKGHLLIVVTFLLSQPFFLYNEPVYQGHLPNAASGHPKWIQTYVKTFI